MTDINIIGDSDGIKLWSLMSQSTDQVEKEYFDRLNATATKLGVVWFSDTIAHRSTRTNQTIFNMKWEADKGQWNVSLFHIPVGAEKTIAERDIDVVVDDDDWSLIDPDDIVNVEL